MLLLDVDGVLSDGKIIYDDRGRETKHFHVRDGAGLACWHKAGRQSAIITARYSGVVPFRAKEMQVKHVYQRATNKATAFEDLCTKTQLKPRNICAIGDDLMDLPVLKRAGLAVAVQDAVPELKKVAHVTTRLPGGSGAVREMIERLLKAQGEWATILKRYYS
jgi:3-deoxy-D-manno-octulosonate 8-phosphate phosphatase (KDO 8-P phosphatase)